MPEDLFVTDQEVEDVQNTGENEDSEDTSDTDNIDDMSFERGWSDDSDSNNDM